MVVVVLFRVVVVVVVVGGVVVVQSCGCRCSLLSFFRFSLFVGFSS